jgi:DNA-binding transcriptional MerR regulator
MISSQKILEQTGIRSGKTLTRWHQQGLIPEPTLQTHPSGRGKMAYWPEWVVFRIKEVKSLLAKGCSLEGIAKQLGSDWIAEERRWTMSNSRFARAQTNQNRMDANEKLTEALADAIYEFLQGMGIQRPGMAGVHHKLHKEFDSKLIHGAVEMIRQGTNPVLVIHGDEIAITADFMLATAVGRPALDGQPVLIVPLGALIRDAFVAKAEPNLPTQSKYVPIERVQELGAGKPRERSYRSEGQWGFEIVK